MGGICNSCKLSWIGHSQYNAHIKLYSKKTGGSRNFEAADNAPKKTRPHALPLTPPTFFPLVSINDFRE
jgi:hypothetical protein